MPLRLFYFIVGVLSIANGIYMLYRPDHWFYNLPAAIPDTGELNAHFIRDFGLAYMISGLGFLWSCFHLAKCRLVHMANTLFVSGHAVLHGVDIGVGRLPQEHLITDAPFILIPGLLMLILCIPVVWRHANPYDLDN
jgi:hypothetical protein